MDIKQEREAFEDFLNERFGYSFADGIAIQNMSKIDCPKKHELNYYWEIWQAAKAQVVPDTQALHDRLLVKSIREHVESHIAEISVADLFDKGWLAAMKCIQNDIDMLEAQEQSND